MLKDPLQVGKITLKNRVVLPAVTDFGMTEEDGLVNDRHIEHYEAIAAGGTGLLITEACRISEAPMNRNAISVRDDSCLPGMTRLAEAIHNHQAAALVQLMHVGRGQADGETVGAISDEELQSFQQDFVQAAVRMQQAGFDGVEVHAAHGYFLNQMAEPNDREGKYGGPLENRLAYIVEIIEQIRQACGEDFLISIRFGNPDYEELTASAKAYEHAGVDLLDVSNGSTYYKGVPFDFMLDSRIYAAAQVKKEVSIPVICVGKIFTAYQCNQIFERDLADLVAIGRGHLCDPNWTQKTLAGKAPNLCKSCKKCLWYMDGRRCPGVKALADAK